MDKFEEWQTKVDKMMAKVEECDDVKTRIGLRRYINALQNHINRGNASDEIALSRLVPIMYDGMMKI